MNILIYGGGAVGLGLASCLIRDHTVDIIARETTMTALRKHGLKRSGIFGGIHHQPESFQSFISIDQCPHDNYDFILVCTKSFDTEEAAEDISEHKDIIKQDGKIVHFQNGWGNAQKIADHLGEEVVFSARMITGFTRKKPHEVDITVHADAIRLGSLFGQDIQCMQELATAITKGGIPAEISEEVDKDLWAKMLYNCALNPLGALLNVAYGLLGDSEYTRDIMNHIFDEIYAVFDTTGYGTHWSSSQEYQKVFYEKLLPSTYDHESSMLHDLRGKKRIEIDAMNGAVVALARDHDLQVPYNQMIYNELKFLEQRNREGS